MLLFFHSQLVKWLNNDDDDDDHPKKTRKDKISLQCLALLSSADLQYENIVRFLVFFFFFFLEKNMTSRIYYGYGRWLLLSIILSSKQMFSFRFNFTIIPNRLLQCTQTNKQTDTQKQSFFLFTAPVGSMLNGDNNFFLKMMLMLFDYFP